MSCTFFFDRNFRIVLVRFGRSLTPETFADMYAKARRFAAKEGPCPGIVDFSAVEEVKIASHVLAEAAEKRAVMTGQKRVVVAPKDEVFGLSRMFGMIQSETGDEPLVVRSLEKAYAVFGIKSPNFEPVDLD